MKEVNDHQILNRCHTVETYVHFPPFLFIHISNSCSSKNNEQDKTNVVFSSCINTASVNAKLHDVPDASDVAGAQTGLHNRDFKVTNFVPEISSSQSEMFGRNVALDCLLSLLTSQGLCLANNYYNNYKHLIE